ncbi:15615_t:CDS:2, partial [Funneliformis caledonium]
FQKYWQGVIKESEKENLLPDLSQGFQEPKRIREDDDGSSIELWKKQSRILEQNKDKLVYRHVVNDEILVASAYASSWMSLSSADEPELQAIVESLLPLRHRVPELSLIMDGKKPKGIRSILLLGHLL